MPLLLEGENSFAKIMKDSIREGLSSLIGQSGMNAVYINFKLDDHVMDPKAIHGSLMPAFKDDNSRKGRHQRIVPLHRRKI